MLKESNVCECKKDYVSIICGLCVSWVAYPSATNAKSKRVTLFQVKEYSKTKTRQIEFINNPDESTSIFKTVSVQLGSEVKKNTGSTLRLFHLNGAFCHFRFLGLTQKLFLVSVRSLSAVNQVFHSTHTL